MEGRTRLQPSAPSSAAHLRLFSPQERGTRTFFSARSQDGSVRTSHPSTSATLSPTHSHKGHLCQELEEWEGMA